MVVTTLAHVPIAAAAPVEPPPGDESGRIDPPEEDSTVRVVARAVLFVPRTLVDVLLFPLRGLVWLDARYQLEDLYYRIFFTEDRTIGIYPTGSYLAGYGVSVGVGLVDNDVFGGGEHLAIDVVTGAASGATSILGVHGYLHTGPRFGWLELGVEANFDQRPDRAFFGLGNGNLAEPPPTQPIDPRYSDTAVATTYAIREARALVFAAAHFGPTAVRATGSFTDLDFGVGNHGPAIDEVYVPDGLVGFTTGVRHVYGELEFRYDDRARVSTWEPAGLHTRGYFASGYAGFVRSLDGGSNYFRYGVEGQTYVRLGMGPRVFAFRFRGDGVTGSRSEVPFAELPALGGAQFLRGYPAERFRDCVAAVATVAYEWDLSHSIAATLFVDTGRVFPALDDISVSHLRVGYGLGLTLFSAGGFVLEGSLASSIDGGLFLNVLFDPVFQAAPVRR